MSYFNNLQTYLFFFILLLAACNGQKRPDISHINLLVKIDRFDQALDSLVPLNVETKNRQWQKQFGLFYKDFMNYMVKAGDPADTLTAASNLRIISKTADFRALSTAVKKTFPDLSYYEEQLTQSFKLLHYYFPEVSPPRLISFFSGFSVQVPVGEDYIGIGLDMFLGAKSEFYPALRESIPFYLSKRFTPEHIVPRVIETFLTEDLYLRQDADRTMLEKMIYSGKILYIMDLVLPADTDDGLKIGYTSQQIAWANAHEDALWNWFIEEKLVYDTDNKRIQRYLEEEPFTPEFGKNSSPKLAIYLGWQIIRKFMSRHSEITLPKLLSEHNAQRILTESGY
ncbi:hypothetical protein SAMN05216436_11028 [bacterium A37T11]|nr:hypothetical protein SAMN05216436_11028 [bacterium A37T11]